MARKHVFPVCSPNFNVLDFDTIDETQSYFAGGSFYTYGGISSTGVKYSATFKDTDNKVAYSNFIFEDGGEYLVNDDISAPSETTLDWTGDFNGIQVNAYPFESIKNSTSSFFKASLKAGKAGKAAKGLHVGEVICIGSKPPLDSAFKRNVLPSVYDYQADGVTYFTPMADVGFNFILTQEVTYDSIGIAWVTLMWSGTRWVYLGSNTCL